MLIEFNINLLVHFAYQEMCACNFPLKTENYFFFKVKI